MLMCALLPILLLGSGVPFGVNHVESIGSCSHTYTLVPNAGMCIHVHNDAKTWDQARKTCNRSGGKLLSIHDSHTFNALVNSNKIPSRKSFWIGLNDKKNEGQYVWLNGKTTARFHNLNLSPAFTRNAANQDCVLMMSGGHHQWYMQSCHVQLPFICGHPV